MASRPGFRHLTRSGWRSSADTSENPAELLADAPSSVCATPCGERTFAGVLAQMLEPSLERRYPDAQAWRLTWRSSPACVRSRAAAGAGGSPAAAAADGRGAPAAALRQALIVAGPWWRSWCWRGVFAFARSPRGAGSCPCRGTTGAAADSKPPARTAAGDSGATAYDQPPMSEARQPRWDAAPEAAGEPASTSGSLPPCAAADGTSLRARPRCAAADRTSRSPAPDAVVARSAALRREAVRRRRARAGVCSATRKRRPSRRRRWTTRKAPSRPRASAGRYASACASTSILQPELYPGPQRLVGGDLERTSVVIDLTLRKNHASPATGGQRSRIPGWDVAAARET